MHGVNEQTVTCDLGGKQLTLSTGKFAKQANGSVLVRYGDTMVLVTATAPMEPKEGVDFFPLTVDYVEKFYAAGKIPGGYFKREAKPTDKATLSARITDRPIRPLFPETYLSDTHLVVTVLSIDEDHEPDYLGPIGASAALTISDIPFLGPIAACRVGRVDGKYIINPSKAERAKSDMEILVAGTEHAVCMVEGGADEASEKECLEAIYFGQQGIQQCIAAQKELAKLLGTKKRPVAEGKKDEALSQEVKKKAWGKFEAAFAISDKLARYEALDKIKSDLKADYLKDDSEESQARWALAQAAFEDAKYKYMRQTTVEKKKRIDGRTYDTVRPIWSEAGVLPRPHGSAVFTRGETQVLSVVSLGTPDDVQRIDLLEGDIEKAFMLHYNFPPYSVGEAGFMRGPGRREIGHGNLAERALLAVVPGKDKFPYTIRVVAEVLESNGSSSMGSVCSGCMALMDAGVPIKAPVAGIAMGLIQEGKDIAILSDILGDEDHLGDMDFKVAGTSKGVTAIQMDIKITGVTKEIMNTALEQAHKGRMHILQKMQEAIGAPRADISQFAPRIHTIKIKQDRIRDLIGTGGKVIRGLVETTGCKIEIQDDGTVYVASSDDAKMQHALRLINEIVAEAEVGKVYKGTVKRIVDFGAFIEILPGLEGLCHISEMAHRRIGSVSEVLKEGQQVDVKVLEIDERSGKIRLSMKALLPASERGPEGGGGGGGGRPAREGQGHRGASNRDRGPSRGADRNTDGDSDQDGATVSD
jgi:polyribonucleotide nucleotidyltransferase